MPSPFRMLTRGLGLRILINISCDIAYVLFGYDQGVFGSIINNPDFVKTFDNPSAGLTGIIVAIYNLGCFAGCMLNVFISDRLGRRRCMWVAMAVLSVGAAIQTSSYSVAQLLVGRIVTGMGTGIETSTVPAYQAELSRPEMRGRLISSEVVFLGAGIVLSYFFDFGMSFKGGPVSWRMPLGLQICFAVVVVFSVFFLPESPRWLAKRGHVKEAVDVICRVEDIPESDPYVQKFHKEIMDTIALEGSRPFRWSRIYKRDTVQTNKRLLLAWGMYFINQMGGINLVVYYASYVLETSIGLEHELSMILGGCIQVMFLLGSLVPAFFLDWMGRVKTMIWGSFGLGICMMMLAILLSVGTRACSSAAVAFFFLYNLIFGMTCLSVPYVYVPEILPLEIRSEGASLATGFGIWIWNFVVAISTPSLTTNTGWKSYLVYTCTNFAFIPFLWYFYPETSNLTLEQIDYIFAPKDEVSELGQQISPSPDEVKGMPEDEKTQSGVAASDRSDE
ncbi:myo-inositol transporter 1 [Niveomyces insectorum RCEF 264]|uniref:Myo-inositol transporter 1 n=1 Tax=Niveomyces insectorum RCEF 264 TaxID=1081102 RepID=A0A167RXY0_9HYPO|nr:myo-inositol transporter 1 [Niveomyces insectorum RCEF 264]